MLSIIIPVYNSENTIQFTLDTILSQSIKNYEIIIINDGSTDNSKSICERYAEKNKNIRVVTQKNSGPSAARNTGILKSVGDYITFIDADDEVDEVWFNNIYKAIKRNNPDVLLFGYNQFKIEGESKKSIGKSRQIETFLQNNEMIIEYVPTLINQGVFNPLWNKVYKSEIIKKNSIELDNRFSLGEDFLFNLEFLKHANKLLCVKGFLYEQIIRTSGLTHSYHENKFKFLKEVTLEFKIFLEKYNLPLTEYYKRLLRNVYSATMDLFHKDCSLKFREKLDVVNDILNEDVIYDLINNYKPMKVKDKITLDILKINNKYILLFISKFFHYKKFIFDKKIKI